jgi:hypothetical protein
VCCVCVAVSPMLCICNPSQLPPPLVMNPYYLRTISTASTWQNLSKVKAVNQCCASSETAKANAAAAAASATAAVSNAMIRKRSVLLLAMMLWAMPECATAERVTAVTAS